MDVVALALACYRTPLAYQNRLTLAAPLPKDMDRLLKLASGSQEVLDIALISTGAQPQELRAAAWFCVQQWCFARGANSYRVLGLEPGASLTQAKMHHRLLMRLLHPDRAAGRETWTEGYAARVNQAWTLLSRAECRKDAGDLPPPLRQAADMGISSADPWMETSANSLPQSDLNDTRKWFFSSRNRLSVQALSGLAMLMLLILYGFYLYLFGKNQVLPIAVTSPAHDTGALPTMPDRSAISTFLTAPDWRALDQREHHPSIQVIQHEQSNPNQALVQQVQARVEASLRERVEPLGLGEQSLVEQAQAEQLAAARLALEKMQAEQAQPKVLALAHQTPSEQQPWEGQKDQPALPKQGLEGKTILSASEAMTHSSTEVSATSGERGDLEIQALNDLVNRYSKVYQQGDLNELMALFTGQKHQRDTADWSGIRQRYANLFRTHLIREFMVHDLLWEVGGETATGVARYQLSLRQRRGGGIRYKDGNIRFEVRRQGDQILLINVIEQEIQIKSPNRTAGGART